MHNEFPILEPEVSEKTDDGYTHIACGAALQGIKVYLSHRDELFALSGDGSVQILNVPYCPVCKDTPPSHGTYSDTGRIFHPSVRDIED